MHIHLERELENPWHCSTFVKSLSVSSAPAFAFLLAHPSLSHLCIALTLCIPTDASPLTSALLSRHTAWLVLSLSLSLLIFFLVPHLYHRALYIIMRESAKELSKKNSATEASQQQRWPFTGPTFFNLDKFQHWKL